MTSKAHHVQEASAVNVQKIVLDLSSSFVAFLKVYQHHVELAIKQL